MTDVKAQGSGTIAIAATFTAEPLLASLRFVLAEAELALNVQFAPYNQIFQELLASTSLLGKNADGVDVLLVRIEDFAREAENVEGARAIIGRVVAELSEVLSQHAQRAKVPTLFAALPASPRASKSLLRALEMANTELVAHARSLPGFILLSHEDIDLVSTQQRYDDVSDEVAHIPFTEEYYAAIAVAIARKVHALRVPAHKVLVLDCDETLWRGVVGEDGVDGITIPPQLVLLQQFAVSIQAQGGLVCLVSKNIERDVLDVFEKRSDMILKIDHVVAHRINWESKPRNLVSLARALNLGLDSFVFIDDNPVECALVRAELPQVVTLQLPPDDEIDSFLSHLWTFDKIGVTDEDARRTAMYRENALRQEVEESATDIAAFVASLGVVVDIAAPEESEWLRLAQLTQRTNQFNFTTVRRTEPELRALKGTCPSVLRVKVRDRFGDYGLVGLVVMDEIGDALVVDTLLLSCRVLGRGVEHSILRRLGVIAQERALRCVDLRFVVTSKNEPARAFVECVAAEFRVQIKDEIVYRIPVEAACAIAHRPGHEPVAVIEARKSEERKSIAPSASVGFERSERYARLAQTLGTGASVLQAARAGNFRARTLLSLPEQPATDTERALLALWQELLGISGLGVEDDYFAVGGTSLTAARLFAQIARRFGVLLPLNTILESPTVRGLAQRFEQPPAAQSGALIELRGGRGRLRCLFLVHDGDGETLLYLNLALRMPDDLAIFGIKPRRIKGVPLAHVTIEEMAAFYLEEVRKKQPNGPYLLGGMCAGGVIAYEMALQLRRAGEGVELVALLDAAAPQAVRKQRRITRERLGRVQQAIAQARTGGRGPLQRTRLVFNAISRKLISALVWEITQRGKRWSVQARFRLLREVLARKLAWPALVPELSVRQIYNSAEARYTPLLLSTVSTVLVRARLGEGDDTPYRQIYADETLGWASFARDLAVIDVDGGHSSMLQEPFVESLAEALRPYVSARRVAPICARAIEATVS